MFGAFALTAVLLAVSGLYGLVSYAVSQRTREIGLRMAMGATSATCIGMILRQAAGLAIGGAAAGLGLASVVRLLSRSVVQDVWIGPAVVAGTRHYSLESCSRRRGCPRAVPPESIRRRRFDKRAGRCET